MLIRAARKASKSNQEKCCHSHTLRRPNNLVSFLFLGVFFAIPCWLLFQATSPEDITARRRRHFVYNFCFFFFHVQAFIGRNIRVAYSPINKRKQGRVYRFSSGIYRSIYACREFSFLYWVDNWAQLVSKGTMSEDSLHKHRIVSVLCLLLLDNLRLLSLDFCLCFGTRFGGSLLQDCTDTWGLSSMFQGRELQLSCLKFSLSSQESGLYVTEAQASLFQPDDM